MTSVYVIRNKITGKNYQSFSYNFNYSNWTYSNPIIEYAEKGWGKQFKDVGKVKTHILYLIGIMMPPAEILKKTKQWLSTPISSPNYKILRDELDKWHDSHPGYKSIPEFMQNDCPLDKIPNEWELVEIKDKKTKDTVVVDFNLSEYATTANKLRILTDIYGSSVRDLYKKLEKAETINQFKYVAVVGIDPSKDLNQYNWWSMVKADQEPVNESLKSMGLKRGEFVKSSKADGIAVAFRSQELAVWFSMTYTGSDKVSLVDMLALENLILPSSTT